MRSERVGDGPTGRVALVFTDVQGSTALWERDAATMRIALAIHDAILRERIARHRGYEVRTEGDAFLVAFADPRDALAWCLDVQRSLVAAHWPASLLQQPEAAEGDAIRGLRVRMGAHLGAVESVASPVTGRTEYSGPAVHRGQCVGDVGHGGQIVVSVALFEAAAAEPDVAWTDLGEHRLRGLEGAEHLVQAGVPELPRTFPPLRSLPNVRTNLPDHPASFLGREADLAALEALAGPGLVTVVGPSGVGKSRLALRFAALRLPAHGSAGVWLCALGGVTTAEGVARRVARMLGTSMAEGEQVGGVLASRGAALLVLDDLDPALAATTVGRWAIAAPQVSFVTTVHRPTGIPGERVHLLGPLPVGEAVALLRERAPRGAAAVRPAALEELAARLGGLPAALETAALRLDVATPEELMASVDELALAQADPARYAWGALSPRERDVLAACTVLRGEFGEDAATAVAGDVGPELARLVEAGALIGSGHRLRVVTRLLPLGEAHLREQGAAEVTRARAHAHAASEARDLELGFYGPRGPGLLRHLAPDAEDLEAAAREATDPEVRAWAALGMVTLAGHFGPTSIRLPTLEAIDPDPLPPDLAVRVIERRGWVRCEAGRVAEGAADGVRGLALVREPRVRGRLVALSLQDRPIDAQEEGLRRALADAAGDEELELGLLIGLVTLPPMTFRPEIDALAERIVAIAAPRSDLPSVLAATIGRGYAATRRGEFERADQLMREALPLARELGGMRVVNLLVNIGLNAEQAGHFADAERDWRLGLHAARAVGNLFQEAVLLNNLGYVRLARGAPALSEGHLRSAVAAARSRRATHFLGYALSNLGTALAELGDLAEGVAASEEGFAAFDGLGDHAGRALMGCSLATTLAQAGDVDRAAVILGQAAESYRAAATPHGPKMVALVEARIDLERARQALEAATARARSLADTAGERTSADVAIQRRRLLRAAAQGARDEHEGPTGELALVFTGTESAAELWQRVPEAMRDGTRTVERTLRALASASGGFEVKTEAASTMLAFGDPRDALGFCLEAQRALLECDWPAGLLAEPEAAEVRGAAGLLYRGLRIRMGIHVGTPEPRPDPVTGRTDYFGPVVNRAARVSAAGHAGQTVLSGRAWELLERALPADAEGLELGVHRLKGLEAAERLVQVMPRELAGRRFPPPRTLDARRTNVSASALSFVGRESELATLDALLGAGSRLLTLTGPAGVGKSRLAQFYAATRLDGYGAHGGCWVVELSGAVEPGRLLRGVADALGVPLTAGAADDDAIELVGGALAARGPLLLVLDDLDQLRGPGPVVAGLVGRASETRVVVCTQRRLGLPAEVVLEVGPLPTPEATQLFLERARGHGVAVPEASLVGELAAQLRGLPLAIELAAAELRSRDAATLLADARAGVSGAAAAIDAALAHASDAAREALATLAAFRAPFSARAAEEVVAGPGASAAVAELRERSLVREVPGDDEERLVLWPSVRKHAVVALAERPDAADIAARHASWAVSHGAELEARLDLARGRDAAVALARLARIGPDLEVTLAAADPTVAARAALLLDRVLAVRGPGNLRRSVLARALALVGDLPPELVARVHLARATTRDEGTLVHAAEARRVAAALGDRALEAAAALAAAEVGGVDGARQAEDALGLARAVGDAPAEVRALALLGRSAIRAGRLAEADELLRTARDRAVGWPDLEADIAGRLAIVDERRGRIDDAVAGYRRAADLALETGDRASASRHLGNLGLALGCHGRAAEATAALGDALANTRELGDRGREGTLVGMLAALLLLEGDSRAEAQLAAAEELLRDAGNPAFLADTIAHAGVAAALGGRPEAAALRFREALAIGVPFGAAEVLAHATLARIAWAAGAEEAGHAAAGQARAVGAAGDDPEHLAILALLGAWAADHAGEVERAAACRAQVAAAVGLDVALARRLDVAR